MKVVRFLFRSSPKMTILTAAVCFLSGGFNGALIAIVHRTLIELDRSVSSNLIYLFFAIGAGKLLTGYYSEVMMTRRAQKAVASLRLELVRKLLQVPFRYFEHIGQARVLSTLTDDVATLNQALYVLPAFAINVAVVVGGALFLVFLSSSTMFLLVSLTFFGAIVYRAVVRRAYRSYSLARDERDRLHQHFVSLIHGMKELKLHRPRRDAYTEGEVSNSTQNLMNLDVQSHSRYIFAHSTTHFCLFLLIGVVIFILPTTLHITSSTVSGYVLTALYLMGPLSGIAGAFPMFSKAGVALERISRLGISLEKCATEKSRIMHHEHKTYTSLEIKKVSCSYHEVGEADRFVLGPVDLEFHPGEIVFITGGNGSGKSTLAKIITGLYEPDEGQIIWDGNQVTDINRDDYRQLFSTIFSDFFLFESLLGLDSHDLDLRASRHLKSLALEKKVSIKDGTLSTIRLSQGQRKRLALLTAYLEDRSIYLFDEWAADQDPSFKEVFYKKLIYELKEAGKTVIVITHDDRYFNLADRRFEMREGALFAVH